MARTVSAVIMELHRSLKVLKNTITLMMIVSLYKKDEINHIYFYKKYFYKEY